MLVAREYKTANVRKKIGRRSKALRMCPIMNVCHLSPAPHSVSRDIRTFLLCWNESRELLPKVHCLSYIIFLSVLGLVCFFFFFRSLKAVICVRAARGGGEPLFTECRAKEPASEICRRKMAGRDAEGQSSPSPAAAGPRSPTSPPLCHPSGDSSHKWYQTPQRERLKNPPVWTL